MDSRPAYRVRIFSVIIMFACSAAVLPAQAEPGMLTVDNYFQIGQLSEPLFSPEGDWIAFTVTRSDLDEDKSISRVWMVPAQGGDPIPLTAKKESSSQPRWSPDGKYLAFLSARDDGKTQLWRLGRQGGEAEKLTDTAQSVRNFEWSPDSKRLALVLQDPKPEELEARLKGDDYKEKTPGPWVIDREQFKTDYVGYLDRRRTHVYILDLESKKLAQLTFGDFDDSEPAWSPNGDAIAFVSNRTKTPDLNYNTDIWVVSSSGAEGEKAPLTRISSNPGADASPAWSPDGSMIVHTSITRPETFIYSTQHLAVSSVSGDEFRVLTAELDRMIFNPRFSRDGSQIYFLLEDGGEQNLARIGVDGQGLERLVAGTDVVRAYDIGPDAQVAVLLSRPHMPEEVFLFKAGVLEQRSFINRELMSSLQLGQVIETRFKSADGTAVEGFIIKPPGFKQGEVYPTILRIHGGPQSQYDLGFNFDAQLMAANGYLLVLPNPRGSTGYGREFSLAIWRNWGGPDYEDVMASVDDAVQRGWADPQRLGVMGWSYGGMLTNHIITKTDRFKAAATGASATLYVANYGHDMYIRWWERELGLPWEPEARERYERISPFNKVQNVVTPTLILGGEKDWNVPIINSEQLYIALKRLGVETELVVYPGEYHGIDTPSHKKDLYQRYLNWFGKRL